jgi:sugar lactone lactonase YvrE
MRLALLLLIAAIGASACAPTPDHETGALRTWTFAEATVFPADRSLLRPEDGVVLPDKTIIVADQTHGLIALSPDGTKRPFGEFAEAGYVHEPPSRKAGPNGVALDPGGKHVLVADIFTGAIYRVDIKSEATERIYAHPFGVNSAHSDSTGAIWFTQSTENAGPESEARMFAAADRPLSDGALYRIAPPSSGGAQTVAELKVAGLDFANGFVIDEGRGELYLSETLADRVLGFKMSPSTGALSDRRVVANVLTPDNIELDESGRLWVASPIRNEVVVISPESGESQSVFRPESADNDRIAAEWRRRGEAGESRLELIAPAMWAPMPGLLTGVILTPGGGPVYLSGLGDALVRLDE